jgi:hypothetical protein
LGDFLLWAEVAQFLGYFFQSKGYRFDFDKRWAGLLSHPDILAGTQIISSRYLLDK